MREQQPMAVIASDCRPRSAAATERNWLDTYRLVDLEDVWGRVEVGVELVHYHMETADLLPHGVGDLDAARPESLWRSVQERLELVNLTNHWLLLHIKIFQ